MLKSKTDFTKTCCRCHGAHMVQTGLQVELQSNMVFAFFRCADCGNPITQLRAATPEDIEAEKERRRQYEADLAAKRAKEEAARQEEQAEWDMNVAKAFARLQADRRRKEEKQ